MSNRGGHECQKATAILYADDLAALLTARTP
jgi:hypothetical protein